MTADEADDLEQRMIAQSKLGAGALWHEAINEIDRLRAELALWRPLTPEEAEAALAAAEAVPLSEEQITRMVTRATDPAVRLPNDEQAQLVAEVVRLRSRLAEAERLLRRHLGEPAFPAIVDETRRFLEGRPRA